MDPTLREGELTGKTLPVPYTAWLLGDRLAIKSRHQYGFDNAGERHEQHEVYEAILAQKEPEADKLHQPPLQVGLECPQLSKLVPWSNKPDHGKCSNEIWREIDNLKVLTDAGCENTPKLIDWCIGQQSYDEPLPGGYIAYIIMEKVPGKDLGGFDEIEKSEQRCIQLAFQEAICYIVDLADAEYDPKMASEGFFMDPWEELMTWQLTKTFDRQLEHIYSKEELIGYWKEHMDEQ